MKFRLTFKTPDVLTDALNYEVSEEEYDKAIDMAKKFLKYEEYLTVEISDESGEVTAKVIEV